MVESFRAPSARRWAWFTRSGPRCAICGTHVHRDDALGFTRNRIVHAECALIRWLEDPDEDLLPPP